MMHAHADNRTRRGSMHAAHWLLIWPVLLSVVLFASLNPVACLIHCAAQSQNATLAPRTENILFCVVSDWERGSVGLFGQSGSHDPNTSVPRAVHELVLLALPGLVLLIVRLVMPYQPFRRAPFLALLPPNPPPKFA